MGALQGIRIVEVANYITGPYASMLLADLGAEVTKVEIPGSGDPFVAASELVTVDEKTWLE